MPERAKRLESRRLKSGTYFGCAIMGGDATGGFASSTSGYILRTLLGSKFAVLNSDGAFGGGRAR